MAVNLNPGADATLVQAAYAAAMANVPHDLSKTFQGMADAYSEAMSTIGANWAEVGKQVGELAGVAVGNAMHNSNMRSRAINIESDFSVDFFTKELDRIRDELRGSYGMKWSEGKAKRMRLQQEKDNLYAQIELLDNAETYSDQLLINGDYSKDGTGKLGMLMKTALTRRGKEIINHDDEKSWMNGYKVQVGKRENGDLFFQLLNSNGEQVTGIDPNGNIEIGGDKPFTVDVNNINKVVVPKNLSVRTGLNKLFADLTTIGQKLPAHLNSNAFTKGGYRTNFINNAKQLVEDELDLHYIMNEANGIEGMQQSFADDLKGLSTMSTEIWKRLGEKDLLSFVKDSTTKEGVALSSKIKDTDKVKGLSKGDFANTENYNVLIDAVLNKYSNYYDVNNTRDLFVDWLARGAQDRFSWGTTMRARSTDNIPGTDWYMPGKGGLGDKEWFSTPQGNQKGIKIDQAWNSFTLGEDFKSYDGLYTFSANKPGGAYNGSWNSTGPSASTSKITTEILTEAEVATKFGFDASDVRPYLPGAQDYEFKTEISKTADGTNPFQTTGGATAQASNFLKEIWNNSGDVNGQSLKRGLEREFPNSPFEYEVSKDKQDLTISIPGTTVSKKFKSDWSWAGKILVGKAETSVQGILDWMAEQWDKQYAELGAENEALNPNE